jgi:alanyl-tRNA synthetase
VPDFSTELCGGTHVRNTAEIGLFKILSEGGVAGGVRRIEAATAGRAFEVLRGRERALAEVAELVRAPLDGVVRKVQSLVDERRTLERRLEEASRAGGGSDIAGMIARGTAVGGTVLLTELVRAADAKALQALGDALRERLTSGIAVLGTTYDDGKNAMLVVVTDDLRDRGIRADAIIRELAAIAGGRGGGKAHMAQAGIPDATKMPAALSETVRVVTPMLDSAA